MLLKEKESQKILDNLSENEFIFILQGKENGDDTLSSDILFKGDIENLANILHESMRRDQNLAVVILAVANVYKKEETMKNPNIN